MRDAIVAAIELNVFNRHSDRVVMANLAQAVNVLQSVILTEGGKMIKTPTYHVFDLPPQTVRLRKRLLLNAAFSDLKHHRFRAGYLQTRRTAITTSTVPTE